MSRSGRERCRFRFLLPQHPHADHHESLASRVAVHERHRCVAASPAAASPLGLGHLLFLFLADGMVVLVEEQPLRALVTRVVGHEQVGAVGKEQAIGVERPEFLVHGGDVAVVPLFELLRLGVAGQRAEEVLIARGLAGIEVAVVEARAFERESAAFGIDLAARDLRAQRIDQPAGANDQGIAVKAVLTVQPKRELAAEVHPQRHMMAIPRRRVVLHQPVHDLLAKEKWKGLFLRFRGLQTGIRRNCFHSKHL